MAKFIFIGDIVGEAGVAYVEAHLPRLMAEHTPNFVVANGENADRGLPGGAGISPASAARLFAAGVDLITGGNHSWDGQDAAAVYADARVLRPLNYGRRAPGAGAAVVEKAGIRLAVVNLVSRTALRLADDSVEALERQLEYWGDDVDLILVDYHGESVTEKLIFAFTFAGQVSAVLGTHTHVPTLDTRVLPGGTAYCTDVGMTGPGGGMQGYDPARFVEAARTRLPSPGLLEWATGPVEFGAVLVTTLGRRATDIIRL